MFWFFFHFIVLNICTPKCCFVIGDVNCASDHVSRSLLISQFHVFYYNKQIGLKVIGHVPPPFTWHISRSIIDIISLAVVTCILTQSNNHWLLNDALNVAISTNLKLKKKMNLFPLLDVLIDDDDFGLNIELETFVTNIKKETISIID